jgi:hypothetical protein
MDARADARDHGLDEHTEGVVDVRGQAEPAGRFERDEAVQGAAQRPDEVADSDQCATRPIPAVSRGA